MEIDVKTLPGTQVSVLNYRCKPAVWEPGTVLDTDVSIQSAGKYRCHYRVKLNRVTTPSQRNYTGALFVTVGEDNIVFPNILKQSCTQK